MYKESCLGIIGYMDILLTFKSLQNIKELRHKDVIPIRLYGATSKYKVQRRQEWEISERSI